MRFASIQNSQSRKQIRFFEKENNKCNLAACTKTQVFLKIKYILEQNSQARKHSRFFKSEMIKCNLAACTKENCVDQGLGACFDNVCKCGSADGPACDPADPLSNHCDTTTGTCIGMLR